MISVSWSASGRLRSTGSWSFGPLVPCGLPRSGGKFSGRTAPSRAKLAYDSVGAWLEGQGKIPQIVESTQGLEDQLWLQDRAASALNDAGLVTLRLNFRGVGQSTGEHDEGRGETEDARVALDYLTTQYPGASLTLAGFSFGSRVGMEVGIADERVRNLISIGTPVDKYDFTFLQECRKPLLFVHGEHDEYGQVAHLQALIERLHADANIRLVVIKGADHFFNGHLDELKRAITEWVKEQESGVRSQESE